MDTLFVIMITIAGLFFSVIMPGSADAADSTQDEKKEISYVYFPMAVPVSVLGETIKRDQILAARLGRQGVKIRFVPMAKGKDAIDLIAQRKLDVVTFSDIPTVEAASGGDMLIIGMIKQSYSSVIVKSGTRLHDLRGKRIGTVQGSTSHHALLQALATIGMSAKDLRLVMMEASELPDAMLNGQIDAFAAWEPVPSAIMAKYPGRFSQAYSQVSQSYFMISRRLATENPETAKEVSAALIRAVRWLKKSHVNLASASRWAADSMSRFTGRPPILSAQEIAKITARDLLELPGAPMISGNSAKDCPIQKLFVFMQQHNQLPSTASREALSSSIKPDFLQKITAASARYDLNRFSYQTGDTP